MTQQTKHTPTPWQVHYSPFGIDILATHKPAGAIARVFEGPWSFEYEANAELIVRAVNAHDDLIATLECKNVEKAHGELSELLEDADIGNDEIRDAAIFLCDELNAFYAKRKAVLAKAEAVQ